MNCKHCGKELKSPMSSSHQSYCKENPKRKIVDRSGEKNGMYGKKSSASNQYIKSKSEGKDFKISEETRIKLSKYAKNRKLTEEQKRRISNSMKKVVREKPESYSASNVNGRVKKVLYKGVLLDSQWELEFAEWCDQKSITWEKNTVGFEYEWKGPRIYYPDFYLTDLKRYVEVKGYERERDLAKWKSVPDLIVVKMPEIKKIRKGKYELK